MKSLMRQNKGDLKGLTNSFRRARDSFRWADDLHSALDLQFNSLKLRITPRNHWQMINKLISCQSQQILKCC